VELIIIRHARPSRHDAPAGEAADPELAELGRQQAERTAEYLMDEGVDHIVASTMKRALQTAASLAAPLGLEVEALDDLRESDHRSSVYVPAEEMDPDDPAVAQYFDGDLEAAVFSDGYAEFATRVGRAFDHIIDTNRSKTVAVYCHGMVVGVYLKLLLGLDDVFSLFVDYCGITRVRAGGSGRRTVRSVNETHHVRDLLGR